METPHLMHTRRCRSINNCLNLVFIHERSFGRHNIPQKHHLIHPKATPFHITMKLLSPQNVEHKLQMRQLILQTAAIHQNIIKTLHNTNP